MNEFGAWLLYNNFNVPKNRYPTLGKYGMAFFNDKNLPIDEITAYKIAENILHNPLTIGYLTISNALQWRLQYKRVIQEAGNISGINKVF